MHILYSFETIFENLFISYSSQDNWTHIYKFWIDITGLTFIVCYIVLKQKRLHL